ncbi:uncharacterized protein LACBIDRAFT_304061 [Laccaria bicolor S238N-H82]|uniref:Predicted protein n=1 Tax=Laccaria bicolor (strain S238N-H82 / ATCC MYA-4686) TaxID=486041 RepID=B0DKV6_LACBS|nr:uncharacterized protein LACBIDRAFT_304061 [Laccaria bicolor S238N-H82]EDR04806.1 predicted protein [Laccaria bicolor S238N-H82]|eukprot:XP_001884630.1 predicted protein [Laccaria bicolor S238N-H82]
MSAPAVAVNISGTFGALLIGGIVASIFSGIVTVQTVVYFKNYSHDVAILRVLVSTTSCNCMHVHGRLIYAQVAAVWFLDFLHTIFVSMSLWDHLIAHFGDQARIDFIPWYISPHPFCMYNNLFPTALSRSLAVSNLMQYILIGKWLILRLGYQTTIALTAALTYLVHGLNNFFISVPLAILATARLCFASLTTNKLITLRSLKRFVQLYTFSFTSGLALSSALDVLITGFLCYLLRKNQKKMSSMNHVLDKLILYSFENGSLTCAAVVVSMICWLERGNNLIFLGLHFVISKFYANSLLATLNTRKGLRPGHRASPSNSNDRQPIMFPDNFRGPRPSMKRLSEEETKTTPVSTSLSSESSPV